MAGRNDPNTLNSNLICILFLSRRQVCTKEYDRFGFDDFFLVADDPVYIEPLRAVLSKEPNPRKIGAFECKYFANGKLLRKGNEETAYAGTDLAYVNWQNIWYIIGASLGLQLHEM